MGGRNRRTDREEREGHRERGREQGRERISGRAVRNPLRGECSVTEVCLLLRLSQGPGPTGRRAAERREAHSGELPHSTRYKLPQRVLFSPVLYDQNMNHIGMSNACLTL